MSELLTTKITDRAGTGSPNFSQGLKISGTDSGLLAPTRTEGATQPDAGTSSNGDTFYDTANDTYDILIGDAWVRVIGAGGGAVNWTISDISAASYDSVSFSTASQDADMNSLFFSSDGMKMYTVGHSSDTVYQYSLTSAFDISTASYDSVSLAISSQDTFPKGLSFSSDGTKMYMSGDTNDKVYQYSLSTAWDLSTASYDSVDYSPHIHVGCVEFNTDGTKMFTSYLGSPQGIRQHTLSTAWDLSTASYDNVSFTTSSQESQPWGLAFNPEGTQMFVTGYASDKVWQYTLSTGFDMSTASYASYYFDVVSQENRPTSLRFNLDGTKMFVLGYTGNTVFQYSTGL